MNTIDFGNIKVYVYEDYESMSIACAGHIASRVKTDGNATLGLATGGSPVGTYEELVRMYREGKIDFSGIHTFNLDEYYPIDINNDQSYHYFMDDNLFNHINIKRENIGFPALDAPDAETSAADYEKRIVSSPRVDLQLIGIGMNGHIGFNEPGKVFSTKTHYVELTESTRQANARFFNSIDDVPTGAITMGIKTILRAGEIVMVVSGENKAEILAKALLGEIDPLVPASSLQLHGNVVIFADKAAAGCLAV